MRKKVGGIKHHKYHTFILFCIECIKLQKMHHSYYLLIVQPLSLSLSVAIKPAPNNYRITRAFPRAL